LGEPIITDKKFKRNRFFLFRKSKECVPEDVWRTVPEVWRCPAACSRPTSLVVGVVTSTAL
jgi:hypothetical protein